MIIVTGAAGFIGSALIAHLNAQGIDQIVAVDDFSARPDKLPNLANKKLQARIPRDQFFAWLSAQKRQIDFVFHLGARTDTTLFDTTIFDSLNLNYSKDIWRYCTQNQIPLVYASSAATYGSGELGYTDDQSLIPNLRPLNPYGDSKQQFDCWVIEQKEQPPLWAGLKFFNVYGPNEYHKGRMASVIFHGFNQIQSTGQMRLFRSHRSEYKDGEQQRDFVYVKDVVKVCDFFRQQPDTPSGIYNLGTGQARSFVALAEAIFVALEQPINIRFVDIPEDIRQTYQYFTEANMQKIKDRGYTAPFFSLELGVREYVQDYLRATKYW